MNLYHKSSKKFKKRGFQKFYIPQIIGEYYKMGRIKTTLIKRNTKKLMKEYGDKISKDFVANKKVVDEKMKVSSKKLRNIIAGYATRLKKTEE